MTPLTKPTAAPTSEHGEHSEQPEVVAVGAVQHQHRQDHGGKRQHAFNREVDRAHQDDECGTEAEHQRDHRRLADAHEIAEAQEVRIDDGNDDAQQRQARSPAPMRPSGIGRCAWPTTHRAGAPVCGCAQAIHHGLPIEMGTDTRPQSMECGWAKDGADGIAARALRSVLDLAAGATPDVVPVELRLGLDVGVVERLRVLGRDRYSGAVELAVFRDLPSTGRTCQSWPGSRSTGPCRPARTDPRRRCRPSRPSGWLRQQAGCRRCRSPAPCRRGRPRAAPRQRRAPCRHWPPRCHRSRRRTG